METNRLLYDDGLIGCCEPVARKTQSGRWVEGLATAGQATPLHMWHENGGCSELKRRRYWSISEGLKWAAIWCS